MKFDGVLLASASDRDAMSSARLVQEAREFEAAGLHGIWAPEATHDPFLALAIAASQTTKVDLGTGIAIAPSRSAMHLAYTANDLQLLSEGRFILGLGSQIKAHIERRFGAKWSRPAARMRETILALRSIWTAWNDGTDLDFSGEFSSHTLMPPFFNPGPNPFGAPKVFLAGVSEHMTEAAGEVADGFCAHSFTTLRYLEEVSWPILRRGRELGELSSRPEVYLPLLLATGATEEEMNASRAAVAHQIAFYASTPAYRKVLELHGWGGLQDAAGPLTRSGRWDELSALVDDDVLDAFAIVAEPAEVAAAVEARLGAVVDRVSFSTPEPLSTSAITQINAGIVAYTEQP